ncbi:ankyrin repeat-containing domain protein [Trichoderma gracile]
MYDLGEDDLLRICVCTLKDNIQAQRQQPTLLILNNVDASCGWQMSVVKKLNETFRGSHLRLKVLITSQRIDTIEQSLGLVPDRISHHFAKEARSKPCKAQKLSMLQTRNKTALHIFRRHYPVVQRLRSTTTNIASLLQLPTPQGLQEFEVGTNSRLILPLKDLALTIILRCMRPLKKAEFESLLNMAIDLSSTTSDKVSKEVEELYGGRFIITQGRSQENLADTQWYQKETESHSYLADWYILRCLRERDGMPWFDADHSLLCEGFWSPVRPDFQSLLADDMAVLNLWAVAKAMRQPAIPCVTARPQTALFILARHGLPQAVDVLPDAFIAAASSGNLETIRVLAQQVELRRFDVDQAVLAAIESKVKEVLVEIGDIAAYLARAASLDNVVALQLSKASFPLSLACYTEKPDILVAMLKHGLSPPQVCRYGGSALVKPLLEHFESKHPRDAELLTSICRELLKKADEYGQSNSLILLNKHMLCLSDAFWSNMENARLLMSPFKQPRIFEDGHALFKEAVFVLFAKAVFGIVQELLQPPITMGEDTFCSLLRTAILKFNEKLIRLICTVGSRSHIDMTYPAVRDTILTEGFIQISIRSNFIVPLLELKLDPNLEVPSLGRSMLGYAAYHNRIDAVRALLAAGAKVDEGGDDWTPLHCAYDNTEITVLLLENGADVNLRDVSTRSALYFASKWGHSGVVSAILGKKPHSDTLEQALGVALQNSQAHIAELLVKHDDDLTTESSDAGAWLAIAVSTSNAALVNLILDRCRGLDINQLSSDEWSEAPLHCISHSTEAIIVRTLAARGADVNILNWRKETPLWKAAAADNLSVAQCLVRRGAKVNGPDNQPVALVEACRSASPDFVKFMLDEGADINAACYANPGTALHAALLRDEDEGEAAARKAQILDVLLNTDGINVRIRSRLWGSVLNAAAMKCQPSIVARLLKMGVTANDVDHLGREPIQLALLQSLETAQLLLREEGVTLDGEDALGRHALHFAVQSQRLDIVEFILRERPLLVDKPDIQSWTPLLWALRAPPTFRGSATLGQLKQVLTLLLNSGASKFVKGDGADGEVWTPARLASYRDLSADVLELVTPNEGELGQCQDLDRDIWVEACGRQGRFQSTAGDGLGFECSDADCTIAMFYMCWKCGLSKESLHSGSTHVLYAIRDETESDERSATSDEDEEEESDEEEGDETEEEEQEGETEEEHGQEMNED